jgi:hypothetical protein
MCCAVMSDIKSICDKNTLTSNSDCKQMKQWMSCKHAWTCSNMSQRIHCSRMPVQCDLSKTEIQSQFSMISHLSSSLNCLAFSINIRSNVKIFHLNLISHGNFSEFKCKRKVQHAQYDCKVPVLNIITIYSYTNTF